MMICGFFMTINHTPAKQPLIILIGPMGAGKTTVGKLLAQQLHFDFFDSDKEIETSAGANIGWIFDKEGEAGFRERETKTIATLTEKNNTILATGGGVVVTPQNHTYLKRGIVIYLRASVDTQYQRTYRDKSRPLLQTENPKQRLTELFAIRDPIYQQLADITIPTGYMSPKKMVQTILQELNALNVVSLPTKVSTKIL